MRQAVAIVFARVSPSLAALRKAYIKTGPGGGGIDGVGGVGGGGGLLLLFISRRRRRRRRRGSGGGRWGLVEQTPWRGRFTPGKLPSLSLLLYVVVVIARGERGM